MKIKSFFSFWQREVPMHDLYAVAYYDKFTLRSNEGNTIYPSFIKKAYLKDWNNKIHLCEFANDERLKSYLLVGLTYDSFK